MSFLKNSQVAKLFNVSHTTVTNWIEAAEKGVNALQVINNGKRVVIIDNPHNKEVIRKLIERGKSHSWTSNKKTTSAKSELYDIFSPDQLSELVSSITSSNEIPYKYTYLNGGADLWDKHYWLSADNKDRVVFKENKLMNDNIDNLLAKFKGFKKVNLFDIGCGNGMPALSVIKYLKKFNIEITYTALDISQRMIEIDKQLLLEKYPEIQFSSDIIDLDYTNLSKNFIANKSNTTDANLIMFLGATIGNQQNTNRVFANIRGSMGLNDFLMIGAGVETNEVKLTATEPHNQYHYKRTTWILDYLGLEGCYPETTLDRYDADKREYTRKILIQKEVDTSVKIGDYTIPLKFNEDDEILVSRFRRFKEEEIFHEVISKGFAIDQFVSSLDDSYVLFIVRPKKSY